MTQRQQLPLGQAQILRLRAQMLYRQGGDMTGRDAVLTHAFEELELALEALQEAEARLRRAEEQMLDQRVALEQSAEHYRQLFTNAPAAYFVTSPDGTIRMTNATAAALLGVETRAMLGRALMLYMPIGQRRSFRALLAQASHSQCAQVFEQQLRNAAGDIIDTQMLVRAERGRGGRPQSLWWLVIPRADTADTSPATSVVASTETDRPATPLTRTQLAALANASELLAQATDTMVHLPTLARLLVPALADSCMIDLSDAPGLAQQLAVAFRDADSQQGSLAQLGSTAALRAALQSQSHSAALVTPVACDGQRFGTLTLMITTSERSYGAADAALAEELAHRLATALVRLQRQG